MIKWNDLYIYAALWFIINSLVGLIISYFISLGLNAPFIHILLGAEISTHCISGSAALAGYVISHRMRFSTLWKNLLLINSAAVFAALLGRELSLVCARIISASDAIQNFYPVMTDISVKLTVPIIILTLLISTIVMIVEEQRERGTAIQNELDDMKDKTHQADISAQEKTGIVFREQGSYCRVDYSEIIYLSSKRKKTLIHTEKQDYEVNSLIKDIESQLPPDIFIRIHKQFIINLLYVKKLQYYEGGRYNLFLKDDDETIVPVGKKYTHHIKEKIILH